MTRYLTYSLFVTLGLGAAGCVVGRSVGRSIGAGAIEAVTKQDSALIAMEKRLLDTASERLNQTFETVVLEPARIQLDSLTVAIRASADSMALLFSRRIRTELNESVQLLLEENLDVLENRAPLLARATARELSLELNRTLPGAFAAVGDTLGKQLVAGLAIGLRDALEPALHKIMLEVTDSLRIRIRQVDTTFAESKTLGGLRYTIIGGSLVFLLGIGALAFGYWRRQGRALNALIDATLARGDPELHESITDCAKQAGVHNWLTDRVTSRRSGRSAPKDKQRP
jgi:hypothetical protein